MKTAQPTAPLMEQAMLRRFIIGLTFGVAIVLSAFASVTPADAQAAPLCTRFGAGTSGLDGWGPCTAAPNIVVTTSTVGSIGGASDYYLHLRDTAGASAACSTNQQYLGDWNQKMGGCGEFCFDFKVFKSGTPPGPITPSFTIWAGPTAHATFVANFTVTSNDPWRQHICAPINLAASPPSNSLGHWVVTGGTWNSIITGVTMIQLPIDWTSDPSEEAGYDNLCMNPQTCNPPPPVIDGCLKDSKVTVKCNPNGTYTVTLSGSGFIGTTITMTSQTPGVTVTPPSQPWSATTNWTITGATPGQTVVLFATSTKTGGGGAEGTDQCCSGKITIVMPDCAKGEVIVEKKVKNDTRAPASVINALVFPIGLACTPPSNLNVSFGLNNGGTHTETNVPYTSVCTVTESVSTLPPMPKDVCGEGSTAVWATPVITVTPGATIGVPVTTFTVVNELKCVKVGSLIVTKKVIYDGPITLPSHIYPVTVNCGGTITQLNLVNGVPQTTGNIPLPNSCSVVEGTVPTPPNVCRPPLTPVWSTTYVPPSSVAITGATATMEVVNTLTCRRLRVCPPPMVLGPADQCICPPGTHLVNGKCEGPGPPMCSPPMVQGPVAGVCVCPPGTVQKNRKCVRRIDCRPPLVPNASGTECVCPRGEVLRRGKCVEVEHPRRETRPKREIKCPRGTVRIRGDCVKPRREPRVIDRLPGLLGGRGDGGGGRDTGGAAPKR
jgi:hypothetical protein